MYARVLSACDLSINAFIRMLPHKWTINETPIIKMVRLYSWYCNKIPRMVKSALASLIKGKVSNGGYIYSEGIRTKHKQCYRSPCNKERTSASSRRPCTSSAWRCTSRTAFPAAPPPSRDTALDCCGTGTGVGPLESPELSHNIGCRYSPHTGPPIGAQRRFAGDCYSVDGCHCTFLGKAAAGRVWAPGAVGEG